MWAVKAKSKTRNLRGAARAGSNGMLGMRKETVFASDTGSLPRSNHDPEPITGNG